MAKLEVKPGNHTDLLLKLIGSLTLCDHMGDVSNDVDKVLRELDINVPGDLEWEDLGDWLARNLGVTTLNGTSLLNEEEEEEE